MQAVPPVFFLEVKCQHTMPFWKHHALKPLDSSTLKSESQGPASEIQGIKENLENDKNDGPEEEEDETDNDSKWADIPAALKGQTFEESMNQKIVTMGEFLEGLKYQVQFQDYCMLRALEHDSGSFLQLAKACLSKERWMRLTRGPTPTTWGKSTNNAMFYHPRLLSPDVDP
jgi:hypothetical protein